MLDEVLQKEIVRKIKTLGDPLRIILFGSRVFDVSDNQSDIDLVIIKDRVKSKPEESVEVWKVLRDIPIAKDILVASREEFDFYKNQAGSILKTANEKGIVIYAR